MNNIYDDCFGQYGWREFLNNKKAILDQYYQAKELNSNRPVKTSHGVAAEAFIRAWLSEFLPKKFAVTSGYVIPNLYDYENKLYHYDIIVYNQLEAPVLWTEGNFDQNDNGKYRAIPAKYIYAIIEVKSTLNKTSIQESIKKLKSLNDIKNQLHKNFISSSIFIELKEQNNNVKTLDAMLGYWDVHNYFGGITLKYENDELSSGYIKLFPNNKDENLPLKVIAKRIDSLNIYSNERGGITVAEQGAGVTLTVTKENTFAASKTYSNQRVNSEAMAMLSWSNSTFSDYCVDLLSYLEGYSIDDKHKTRFGKVFDYCKLKKARIQEKEQKEGMPYLEHMFKDGVKDTICKYEKNAKGISTISFKYCVANKGDVSAVFSSDMFKSEVLVPPRNVICTQTVYEIENGMEEGVEKLLNTKGIEIPVRGVYYPSDDNEDNIAIETTFLIKRDKATIINS